MLLRFQLCDANLNLFMSFVNLILNHLKRIKKSVQWIIFCRISLTVFLVLETQLHPDVARTVSCLHRRGIAYRNTKPVNVLVSSSHYKS